MLQITALRHGGHAHRYFSANPAWRRGQLSTLRPVFGTGTMPTGTSVPIPRGEAVIYHPFATATLPTGTPVASPRAEQSNNLSKTGLKPDLDRSSARRPLPQVSQCHPGVAKGSAVGSTAALRHGHPAHKPLSGIPAWRRGLLTGLRHGALAHRYFSGIPTWRRGSSDRSSARPPCLQVLQGQPHVAKMVFYLRSSMK